jgi:hypothetical protein
MEKTDIKEICLKISLLCQQNGNTEVADTFRYFASEIDKKNWDTLKSEIISMFNGSMGSFNDLVLYKGGKVQIAATNELDKLRHLLYNQVTSNW